MRIFLILLLLLLPIKEQFAQKKITIDQAIKIALNNNVQIMKIKNGLTSVESNAKAAFGELLPTVSGSLRWDWSRSENKDIPTRFNRSFGAGVNSDWILFDGLANYAYLRQRNNDYESAVLDIKQIKQDIVFQTISYYYDLTYYKKLLKVREDDLAWNKKNLEIINERNMLGSVTLADVYQQQVKVGTSELELIKANNNYETAKSSFLYFLGIDILESYDISDSDENLDSVVVVEDFNIDNLKAMIQTAFNKRPDYLSAKIGLNNAYEQINISKAGHMPVLRNNFGINTNGPQLGSIMDSKDYSFGLSLSIPIFSGWSVENRIQLAEVDLKNKQIDLNNLEKEITKDMQKTYLDMIAAQKGLEVSRKNVTASSENRRIEEEKYLLGSTTLLNVLISNSEYTNAVSSYISARISYMKLKEELDYRIGSVNFDKYENQ